MALRRSKVQPGATSQAASHTFGGTTGLEPTGAAGAASRAGSVSRGSRKGGFCFHRLPDRDASRKVRVPASPCDLASGHHRRRLPSHTLSRTTAAMWPICHIGSVLTKKTYAHMNPYGSRHHAIWSAICADSTDAAPRSPLPRILSSHLIKDLYFVMIL